MKEFPGKLYITVDPNYDGEPDGENLLAHRSPVNAIEDDGPTTMAEYRLITTFKMKKQVVEVK